MAVIVFLVGLSAAGAVPLTPGTSALVSGTLDPFAGATLLTSTSVSFAASDYSGVLTQYVYGGGSLPGISFGYSITTDSSGTAAIERVTLSSFTGFATNADFVWDPASVTPTVVSRQLSGSSIGFTWLNVGIAPGTTTPFLYILTDATAYSTGGNVSFINGFVANVSVYKPIGVPEPMSLLLVASGLVAVGIFRWKRQERCRPLSI